MDTNKVYVALTSIAFEADSPEDALARASEIGRLLGYLVEQPLRLMEYQGWLQEPWLREVYCSRPSKAIASSPSGTKQAIL